MRESIGSAFLYNIIFVFIILVMFLLTATINYYKSYKVNNMILKEIEASSGYNSHSKDRIEEILDSFGYTVEGINIQNSCPKKRADSSVLKKSNDKDVHAGDTKYLYCVYYYSPTLEKGVNDGNKKYYSYGVTTFIYVELPIVGRFKIPVYTKGERIYKFDF